MSKKYSALINKKLLFETLHKKCTHRNASHQSIDDFFTDILVSETSKHWQNSLRFLIHDLPECNHVIQETKTLVAELFRGEKH